MNRRIVLCGLTSFAVALPSLGRGQSPSGQPVARVWPWRKIPSITVVAAENDFRIQFVREAVEYWNGQFGRMGSRFRLGSLTTMTGMLPVEDLKAFWEKQLTLTEVDLPVSVREVEGDVVVALSDGDFRAFSYRAPWSSKSLIAIPRLPETNVEILENRLGLARFASHMIAHEFGHVIGLGHNDDTTSLMCGAPAACRHPWEVPSNGFLPLTDGEWAILLKMYPRNWRPDPSPVKAG